MKSFFTSFLLLFLISLCAQAQVEQSPRNEILSSEAPTLRFEHLGLEDGLAQSSGLNIIQDSKGFIWISTQGGLHRYDGYEFKVYKAIPFDTTSLAESWVWGVTESKDGDLWVSTMDGGLNKLDPETGIARHYRHDSKDSTSISNDRPMYSLESSKGELWVGTLRGGLNRMRLEEDGVFERFFHDPNDPNSITSDLIFWLSEDRNGNIWASTANGITKIDPETDKITRYFHNHEVDPGYRHQANVFGQYISPIENEIIWFATGEGLVRLNTATDEFERFLIEPGRSGFNSDNFIHEVRPDPNDPNILWVGGPGTGIARFDLRTEKFTSYRNNPQDKYSLSDNDVQSMLLDETGMMWVGTNGQGLNKFNPRAVNFNHIVHSAEDPESISPGIVWGIYEDRFGSLWVGTNDGSGQYLTQFNANNGKVRIHQHNPSDNQSLPLGNFWAFAEDENDQFWVAGLGGLSRFDRNSGKVKRYQFDNFTGVFSLKIDLHDPNMMWVGSENGLHTFNLSTEEVQKVELIADTTVRITVLSLFSNQEGTLFAGTATEGFFTIKEMSAKRVSKYNPRDTTQINNNSIQVIHQRKDEPNIVWLGTSNGGGINRYDLNTGTAKHYMKKDGLAGNIIYGILEDDNRTFWISTNAGISNFNPDTEEFRNYGLDDGLIALEYSQNAYFKGNDGTLYFGSNEGVTAFLPENLIGNSIPPRVSLTDFKISNNSIKPGPDQPIKNPIDQAENVILKYDQNEISIDYVGLHFANPTKNQYTYQLVGFDEDWVDAGTKRSAIYTNLPPGEYTFKVKAANSDGVWNEKGASIDITVLPPWYRTWWAYLLFAAMLALIIFLVDRIQRFRISKKENERAALREAELRAEAENKRRADTEKLSKIGKDITSSLSVNKVIDTIYENVNALMDAAIFSVGIYNKEKNALDFPAIKEKGKTLAPYSNHLDEEHWLSVVCFKEKREIIIGDFQNEYSYYLKSKTQPLVGDTPNSIIYLPLSHKGEVTGVITTQSFTKNAYTDYHLNILRNLANYAAIAMDNASTYRKLSLTQEQLVYSEKMASLGELTAGIAHEIQNPLNFVNNFSELNHELLDDLREAIKNNDQEEIEAIYSDLRENENKITHHGKRAEDIVKSMLQHSRGGDGVKELTDLNALADEYLRLAYHGLRAKDKSFNAEFKAELDPKLSEIDIVPQDIGRVLLNLINNSFQAVSEEAKKNSNGYLPIVEVSTKKKHNEVEIVVKDNGPGVPEEIKEKIFQPFFTTKPTGEGTGLGLSMSFDIITKGHNGNIELQTKKGETKFIITLPTR